MKQCMEEYMPFTDYNVDKHISSVIANQTIPGSVHSFFLWFLY